MSSLILLLAVTLAVAFAIARGTVHQVYPEDSTGPCSEKPCTFQEYADNSSEYFTNNSLFIFYPGQHLLKGKLVLTTLNNISLTGLNEGAAVITLFETSSISCQNIQGLTLSNVEMHYQGNFNTKIDTVSFKGLNLFIISGVEFKYVTLTVRAGSIGSCYNCSFQQSNVEVHHSKVNFSDALFTGSSDDQHQYPLRFSVSDVLFNNLVATSYNSGIQSSVIYSLDSNVSFEGTVLFSKNGVVSTIKLQDSTAEFTGNGSFNGNEVSYGGAISLDSGSKLRLVSPVEILFINNTAAGYGGAIYVEDTDFSYFNICDINHAFSKQSCFFEVVSNNITFSDVSLQFTGNIAMAGSALYGGALEKCKVDDEVEGYTVFKQISKLADDQTISSIPLKICICNNESKPLCSARSKVIDKGMMPGEKFHLSIAAMGQVNATVANLGVSNSFQQSDLVVYKNNSLSPGCNNVTFVVYSTSDNVATYWWDLYPYGCEKCTNSSIRIEVPIKQCPKGFNFSGDSCICSNDLLTLKTVECNLQSELIEVSSENWIKPNYEQNNYVGISWSRDCLKGYCRQTNKSDPAKLDFSSPNNSSDSQCVSHRTGVLCGTCADGYSLSLNNFKCVKCANKSITLVLVFLFAGVSIIVLLLSLYLNVATGTINGLVLYANIVSVHRDVLFPQENRTLYFNPLDVFISWLNLDFGISICFYDGLNANQYSWLQYAFPLYIWFLTGMIVLGSKYSSKIGSLLGSNPIAVLATIILMSYNKILETAMGALFYSNVHSSNGETRRVWQLDGNINYFEDKRHIALASVAILVLAIILVPFVLLLTFGYHLQKYSDKKGFTWFNKLTPILDAYYAPYHKNMRFWPGLMLIVRIGLFLSYAYSSDNLMVIVTVFSAIMVTLQLNVYKSIYINFLEASFSLNLCVLSGWSYHIYHFEGNQSALYYICTGVAAIEFLGILVYHINVFFEKHFRISCGSCFKKSLPKESEEVKAVATLPDFTNYREPLLSSRSNAVNYS